MQCFNSLGFKKLKAKEILDVTGALVLLQIEHGLKC